MLLRRIKSTRTGSRLALGITIAILALMLFAPSAFASGHGHPPVSGDPGSCGWYGSYYNNVNLQGMPALQRCDAAIDFYWKGDAPAPAVQPDNFSVRWVRSYGFSPGTYRFKATMDDGMRFYLDGALIINGWQEGAQRTLEADVVVAGGTHKLVVEYFDLGGNAVAGFTWELVAGTVHPPKPMPPMHPPMPPTEKPMPPAHGGVDYPVAEVKASYLNVRSGPGVSNSVVGVLRQNDKVYMMARSSGGKWILVHNDGVQGWVNRYYLYTNFPFTSLPVAGTGSMPPPPPKPQPPMEPTAVVNASVLNVRSGPGVQFRAIAVVHGGTEVVVLNREANGWVKIRLPSGTAGYVNGHYLTFK